MKADVFITPCIISYQSKANLKLIHNRQHLPFRLIQYLPDIRSEEHSAYYHGDEIGYRLCEEYGSDLVAHEYRQYEYKRDQQYDLPEYGNEQRELCFAE